MSMIKKIVEMRNRGSNELNDKQEQKEECTKNYHIIFEQATDAIMVTDFKGNFIDVNASLCNLFGYTKEELLRSNVKILLDAEHIKNFPLQFDLLKKGKNLFHERKMVRKDGLFVYVEVNVKKFMDDRIMAIARDITERKKIEEELLTRKVQEQRTITKAVLHAQEVERNRMGQELHDNVNQILSSIKLYLAMIEEDPAAHKDMIAKTKEFTDQVINEIRSICKEQVTPQKKFDLLELLQEITSDLNDTQEDILFTCHVIGPITIDDDLKLNIYRIVQEQVNNILKYSQASEARIHIEESKGLIELAIVDNGKGFDPIIGRKGIGITNIMNRVESYNGHFIIDSKPGEGCKILITLPV